MSRASGRLNNPFWIYVVLFTLTIQEILKRFVLHFEDFFRGKLKRKSTKRSLSRSRSYDEDEHLFI